MYCIARRCVLPALTQEQRNILLAEASLRSLFEVFEAVPDPRSAHGLRSDLPFLLPCLAMGLLCNCDSTEAVAQWCHDQVDFLCQLFGPDSQWLALSSTLTSVGRASPGASAGHLDPSDPGGSC